MKGANKMARVLLFDGDTLGYRAVCATREEHQWDDCNITLTVNIPDALNYVVHCVSDLRDFTAADQIRMYFSGPREKCFRKKISSDYKANRGVRSKVLGLTTLKQVLNGIYRCETNEHLEADDLIGMQATAKDDNEYIIVGNDKDYFTVPGEYINHTKIGDGIQHTTLEEANYHHLVQTLMGDRVDNYCGCPGIGKRKAEQIAVNGWGAVVQAYRDAGKTEDDALINARLAYILRNGDVDKHGKVKQWKPQTVNNE